MDPERRKRKSKRNGKKKLKLRETELRFLSVEPYQDPKTDHFIGVIYKFVGISGSILTYIHAYKKKLKAGTRKNRVVLANRHSGLIVPAKIEVLVRKKIENGILIKLSHVEIMNGPFQKEFSAVKRTKKFERIRSRQNSIGRKMF